MTLSNLAHFMLKDHPSTEEERIFLTYLLDSLRLGHLTVQVEPELYPPSEREAEILKGAKTLPLTFKGVHREGSLIWLERIYQKESSFKQHLQRLIGMRPHFDLSKVESELDQKVKSGTLLEEQREAILRSLAASLSLIVGGPGTGKTFTAGQLVKMLLSALNEEERENFSIVLAAPTGKAALQLKRGLQVKAESKTLHSLLGLSPRTPEGREAELIGDLFIVDEASMIDLDLMERLFRLIPKGARLILIGDPNQLPPVEAGSLFADLTQYGKGIAVSRLTRCMRSEMEGILAVAAAALDGDVETLIATKGMGAELDLIGEEKVSKIQERLLAEIKPHFKSFSLKKAPTIEEIKELTSKVALLLPTKVGPFGTIRMNELITQHLLKSDADAAVPVMILKNVPSFGLFNGDMGLLFRGVAYFLRTDGEELSLFRCPSRLLPPHQVGFALSIHKSQGSEFQTAIVLMESAPPSFGRELFYTAVTRAKKELKLLVRESALREILAITSRRISSFSLPVKDPIQYTASL